VDDGELVEMHFDVPARRALVGNVYLGKVETVLPGMGAAFVNVGEKKALFLSGHEISDPLLIAQGFEPWKESVPIQKVLRSGDTVLIQVRREGVGKKNPQGTMKISLPGRYWVYLPTENRVGISRRVGDRDTARRLRQIAYELKRETEGLIGRTAALGAPQEDLERDFLYLQEIWEGIQGAVQAASPPKLLHEPLDLTRALIRDRFLDSVGSVIVDDDEQHKEILDFLEYLHLPRLRRRVRLYRGTVPLFARYDLERQLRDALQHKIPLQAGGFLVVNETEALTAIDVNTGSDVRHRNQDAAILSTNLEAAKEIPRILRLRKISGIIIVDLVDMESDADKEKVIALLQQELKKDRVPADFIDITKLGLVEITRRREGESLATMIEDIADG
jgi:ribonuclease G